MQTIMIGGIGGAGYPKVLIRNIINNPEYKDLHLIFTEINAIKDPVIDIGDILKIPGKVKKITTSHMGYMFKDFPQDIEVEILPMGILNQKIQAGANKLPGVMVERTFASIYRNEEYIKKNLFHDSYVFESALTGDIALIKVETIDANNNIMNVNTQYNSHEMVQACTKSIAEYDNLMSLTLKPNMVTIEGVWINDKKKSNPKDYENIEWKRFVEHQGKNDKLFERIAERAEKLIENGMIVNLGFGKASQQVLKFCKNKNVMVQAESCIVGMSDFGGNNPNMIDPGGYMVQTRAGAAKINSSCDAFSMIGHKIDITFLGGLQVGSNGDLANWAISENEKPGLGGVVELCKNAKKVVVCMLENDKTGKSKMVDVVDKPLSYPNCVDIVITEQHVYKHNGTNFDIIEKWDETKNQYVKI